MLVKLLTLQSLVTVDFQNASKRLMDAFMDKVNGNDAVTLQDFYDLSSAWIGVNVPTYYQTALTKVSGDDAKVEALNNAEYAYYEGTAYGDLIRKVQKITSNPLTNKTDIENEFTGSNTYTVAKGFEKQLNQLKATKNYVKTGWYRKDSTSTGLPSKLESYLFNTTVQSSLDNADYPDRANSNDLGKENKYVAKVNGKYYLKAQSHEFGADDLLHYDSSSDTYYVIQIDEAVAGSKLRKTGNSSYYNRVVTEDKKYDNAEDIIGNVLSLYDEDSAYQSQAKEFYLEEMALEYHDTVVYDYFKSNYPDLFD